MAYKIAKQLIRNFKNRTSSLTKERMVQMFTVYFKTGKLTDVQYKELIEELSTL